MNRRKRILIVGAISLMILAGFIFLFIILPFMILAPYPAELFDIHNWDDVNHTVRVEIFNSANKSIYLESFDLNPDDSIEIDRGFDWCPKSRFWWLFWDEGSYTFYVSLDDTYNISHYTELYPSKCIEIFVIKDDTNPLEIYEAYQD